MNGENKNAVIAGAAVLAIALAVFIGWYFGSKAGVPGEQQAGTAPQGAGMTPEKSQTLQAVDPNTVVPDASSTVPANVAAPQLVTQASPNSQSNFRSFSLTVSGNEFTPNTVIVNVGDTVHLNIMAMDKDYDFTQPDTGLSQPLPKGVSKVVEFQATVEGKYTFYCKSCGGPAKGPVGYVTAVPKK